MECLGVPEHSELETRLLSWLKEMETLRGVASVMLRQEGKDVVRRQRLS